MYRLNMNLQISLCRSLMVTLITRIFDLTLLASVQAGEHLLGQGCPVLFITLSSLILAGKWGGSRVQWGGWSFFRPRCPHQSGATSQHSLSEYLHSESFLTTEKPALSCPDNLSLTQEVTDLLMSGQPSPSTASSSKVLRVVTSDFQNFHLTANKVFDWFVVVLIDDINIVLRKQNLYLLKKKSLDLFDLSVSALFEVISRS